MRLRTRKEERSRAARAMAGEFIGRLGWGGDVQVVRSMVTREGVRMCGGKVMI